MKVSIAVNGESTEHDVEPRVLLVHYIREVVGLTGTNVGCDTSSCGACTIHLDGEAVKSCTVLAVQAHGHAVTTIEGWVKPVARINPLTNILRLAREGFLPGGITWHDTWGGLLAMAASLALLGLFAVRGLRKVLN